MTHASHGKIKEKQKKQAGRERDYSQCEYSGKVASENVLKKKKTFKDKNIHNFEE